MRFLVGVTVWAMFNAYIVNALQIDFYKGFALCIVSAGTPLILYIALRKDDNTSRTKINRED